MSMSDGVQTHEDIPEIPPGVEVSNSEGSLIPNVEEPVEVDYGNTGIEDDYPSDQRGSAAKQVK